MTAHRVILIVDQRGNRYFRDLADGLLTGAPINPASDILLSEQNRLKDLLAARGIS